MLVLVVWWLFGCGVILAGFSLSSVDGFMIMPTMQRLMSNRLSPSLKWNKARLDFAESLEETDIDIGIDPNTDAAAATPMLMPGEDEDDFESELALLIQQNSVKPQKKTIFGKRMEKLNEKSQSQSFHRQPFINYVNINTTEHPVFLKSTYLPMAQHLSMEELLAEQHAFTDYNDMMRFERSLHKEEMIGLRMGSVQHLQHLPGQRELWRRWLRVTEARNSTSLLQVLYEYFATQSIGDEGCDDLEARTDVLLEEHEDADDFYDRPNDSGVGSNNYVPARGYPGTLAPGEKFIDHRRLRPSSSRQHDDDDDDSKDGGGDGGDVFGLGVGSADPRRLLHPWPALQMIQQHGRVPVPHPLVPPAILFFALNDMYTEDVVEDALRNYTVNNNSVSEEENEDVLGGMRMTVADGIRIARFARFGRCFDQQQQRHKHPGVVFPHGHKLPFYNPDHGPNFGPDSDENNSNNNNNNKEPNEFSLVLPKAVRRQLHPYFDPDNAENTLFSFGMSDSDDPAVVNNNEYTQELRAAEEEATQRRLLFEANHAAFAAEQETREKQQQRTQVRFDALLELELDSGLNHDGLFADAAIDAEDEGENNEGEEGENAAEEVRREQASFVAAVAAGAAPPGVFVEESQVAVDEEGRLPVSQQRREQLWRRAQQQLFLEESRQRAVAGYVRGDSELQEYAAVFFAEGGEVAAQQQQAKARARASRRKQAIRPRRHTYSNKNEGAD